MIIKPKKTMKKIILFFALHLSAIIFAQPGTLDTSFNTTDLGYGHDGTGANNTVWSTALQSDGKIIVGGGFTFYNGIAKNNLVRLNVDGSLDTGFNSGSGPNSDVNAAIFQQDGKIIIGGAFTSYNGFSRNYIARLNADGSLDTSFNSGAVPNFSVYSIAIQQDGKIIIGGAFFADINNVLKTHIARLNPDGTVDTSFNIGTGADGVVYTTIIQADGKIIIGGDFINYNGTIVNHIARLNTNGSLDISFNTGTGADDSIYTSAIQKDGKIIIGGYFNFFNGTNIRSITRLNTNGSLDTSFTPSGVAVPSNSIVETISIQNDGEIIVGGSLVAFSNNSKKRLVRLSGDGTLDINFTIEPGTSDTFQVYTTTIQPDGKIIIGGDFTSYNGIGRNRIARINGNTLGIEKYNYTKLNLLPNPTTCLLNLQFANTTTINKVTITDLTGKVVLRQNTNSNQVNVDSLASGIYILEAFSEDKKFQGKFVKE